MFLLLLSPHILLLTYICTSPCFSKCKLEAKEKCRDCKQKDETDSAIMHVESQLCTLLIYILSYYDLCILWLCSCKLSIIRIWHAFYYIRIPSCVQEMIWFPSVIINMYWSAPCTKLHVYAITNYLRTITQLL